MPLGDVLSRSSGELKNIICERTDSMEPILSHVIPEFTANLCAPIMLFIYIIAIDWRMALFVTFYASNCGNCNYLDVQRQQ